MNIVIRCDANDNFLIIYLLRTPTVRRIILPKFVKALIHTIHTSPPPTHNFSRGGGEGGESKEKEKEKKKQGLYANYRPTSYTYGVIHRYTGKSFLFFFDLPTHPFRIPTDWQREKKVKKFKEGSGLG